MKLKNKLRMLFLLITVIPMALSCISILVVGHWKLYSIQKYYNVDDATYSDMSNSTYLVDHLTKKIQKKVRRQINRDSLQLQDREYLESVNKELKKYFSFLVVRIGEEYTYIGNEAEAENLMDYLPRSSAMEEKGMHPTYLISDGEYLVKQENFSLGDKQADVFIISSVDSVIPQIKVMIIEMILAILFSILVVALVLTYWIYQSIIKPMQKLRIAAKNISEGNLDFTIEVEQADEIGDLCRDFEQMRRRLKDNAAEKLRDDIKNKELICNISHDLKTPITTIKGYVEGIMDGVADTPEKMERYLQTIYHKANDMNTLIGELTLYSQIDSNHIPYHFSKVNLSQYFLDCSEELSMELEAKNIQLTYINELDKDTVIIADAEQFKRVINNIISNSVKYIGDKKGSLKIHLKDENDFVHIEIEDNGKGIPPKELPLIFERFYRTDASRNSMQGGSGIGLSIAKKVMEAHGGMIWATSQVGEGTTMHLLIRKHIERVEEK